MEAAGVRFYTTVALLDAIGAAGGLRGRSSALDAPEGEQLRLSDGPLDPTLGTHLVDASPDGLRTATWSRG